MQDPISAPTETSDNTIQLKWPITLASGKTLTEVTWRRLKARDLLKVAERAGKNEHRVELFGIAAMLRMVPEDVEELDGEDFMQMKSRFYDILGASEQVVASNGRVGSVVSDTAE